MLPLGLLDGLYDGDVDILADVVRQASPDHARVLTGMAQTVERQ
jgi:hypothetical protein